MKASSGEGEVGVCCVDRGPCATTAAPLSPEALAPEDLATRRRRPTAASTSDDDSCGEDNPDPRRVVPVIVTSLLTPTHAHLTAPPLPPHPAVVLAAWRVLGVSLADAAAVAAVGDSLPISEAYDAAAVELISIITTNSVAQAVALLLRLRVPNANDACTLRAQGMMGGKAGGREERLGCGGGRRRRRR